MEVPPPQPVNLIWVISFHFKESVNHYLQIVYSTCQRYKR